MFFRVAVIIATYTFDVDSVAHEQDEKNRTNGYEMNDDDSPKTKKNKKKERLLKAQNGQNRHQRKKNFKADIIYVVKYKEVRQQS